MPHAKKTHMQPNNNAVTIKKKGKASIGAK
jgi:hypothetical protein